MAWLKIIKGANAGQRVELLSERSLFGRHPNCEVVLDNAAVSRYHAQILESHGHYYLEDLRSRNGTFLNDEAIETRVALRDGDEIRICDALFRFHARATATRDTTEAGGAGQGTTKRGMPSGEAAGGSEGATDPGHRGWEVGDETPAEVSEGESSILSTLSTSSSRDLRLDVNPQTKLRAVLEIGHALAQVLDLESVLQKTLEILFQIFPQADEGFVMLKESDGDHLVVRATKSRTGQAATSVDISMTVVRRAMEIGEAILSADAGADPRFEASDSVSSLKIRSMMCTPLLGSSREVLGVLQIDTKKPRQQFTQEDLDLLTSVSAQAGLAVENAALHEEVLRQRDMERDLEFATQVQLGFLPNRRPVLAGYEFADYYEPADRVGGDYFDYIPLPDGRIAIAVGDVAGKGVPAALLMARLSSAARFHLCTQPSVAEALSRLDAEIASSGLGHRFITFVVAVVDPDTRRITISNAGHFPPLVRNPDGTVGTVDAETSSLPMGIAPGQTFEETVLTLEPGAVLVLYTDGVTEAMNPQGAIYGRERLANCVGAGPGGAAQLVDAIVSHVEEFCRGHAQRDDMCLVCVRRTE